MTHPDARPLYEAAIAAWGKPAQIAMLHEEVGELLVAIGHTMRGRCSPREVGAEIADVRIMLDQLEVMLALPEDYVDGVARDKLDRLRDRLGKDDWAGTSR